MRRPTSLQRHLALVSARAHGVGPEHVGRIGTDADLFEAFYLEHVEGVQRFVARRVADAPRAADLTAEVFLAAIEAAARYRPAAGSPRAWLYGIARIVVANDSRRRDAGRSREERWGAGLTDAEDLARIDARIDAAFRSRELYAAMGSLSEGERAVLELVALDDLTIVEAAAAVGVRPATARVRLFRARRRLKAELAGGPLDTRPEEAR